MSPLHELPMFPLGSVLFPTMVLPLHVFEPRYRALAEQCLAGDKEFGVCLIERGSEVGGGDLRTDTGTVAQIVDAEQFDDGRWVLACVGTRRIRIDEWLPDDPFPRAMVEPWPDDTPDSDLSWKVEAVIARLRQVLALQAELGDPAPPATIELDTDPVLAGYQVAALSPCGSFDRQRLLAASSADGRLSLLDELLGDAEVVLRHRLASG